MRSSTASKPSASILARKTNATHTTLKPSKIPSYLQDSEFGASLDYDDDDEFFVPIGVTKPTSDIDSLKDLSHYLATVRFWGIDGIPVAVFEFAFASKDPTKVMLICNKYAAELKQLTTIARALRVPEPDQMNIAMSSGYLELVQYLHTHGRNLTDDCIRLAIQNDQIHCGQYALGVNTGLVDAACAAAVVHGSPACIRAVLTSLSDHVSTSRASFWWGDPKYTLCDVAACVGDIAYIKDARKRRWPLRSRAVTVAACHGQLDCMKYLHDVGCYLSDDTVSASVRCKQFECAAYALQYGAYVCVTDYATLDAIVAAGEIRCLVLLSGQVHSYCKNRVQPCLLAAQHGHVGCLTFLHENEYCWDATVTTAAAQAGHYDCLRYAIQHGCPVNKQIYPLLVILGGEELLLQFALVASMSQRNQIAVTAAANGYMNCLSCAVEHGCRKVSAVCTSAAAGGHLSCLQYLNTRGFPTDHNTSYQAAHNGHYDCLQYLLEQRCAVDVLACESLAAKGEVSLLALALRQFGYVTTNVASTSPSSTTSTRINATASGAKRTGIGRGGCVGIMAAAAGTAS